MTDELGYGYLIDTMGGSRHGGWRPRSKVRGRSLGEIDDGDDDDDDHDDDDDDYGVIETRDNSDLRKASRRYSDRWLQ